MRRAPKRSLMKTTIDSVPKPCCPSYHFQTYVIPVFSRAWTRFTGSTVSARKRPESRFIRPREVIKDAGHKSGRSPWAPPSGCRSFSRYTSIGSTKSHRSRKNRHEGTSKDIVNSKKGRYVHKRRKTMERQSLTNSHRQSRWINIDLGRMEACCRYWLLRCQLIFAFLW